MDLVFGEQLDHFGVVNVLAAERNPLVAKRLLRVIKETDDASVHSLGADLGELRFGPFDFCQLVRRFAESPGGDDEVEDGNSLSQLLRLLKAGMSQEDVQVALLLLHFRGCCLESFQCR